MPQPSGGVDPDHGTCGHLGNVLARRAISVGRQRGNLDGLAASIYRGAYWRTYCLPPEVITFPENAKGTVSGGLAAIRCMLLTAFHRLGR